MAFGLIICIMCELHIKLIKTCEFLHLYVESMIINNYIYLFNINLFQRSFDKNIKFI